MQGLLVFFNLTGKNVTIIGGGPVSERKAKKFLKAGAKVKVISSSFTSGLNKLKKKLELINASVGEQVSIAQAIKGADIVIAATNNSELNEKITKTAQRAKKLVNRADDIASCDIVIPAIARIGDIQIGIYTQGKSPALSRFLRQRIEKSIKREDIFLLDLLSKARKMGKLINQRKRNSFYQKILNDPQTLALIKKRKIKAAQLRVRKIFDSCLSGG
ncbi:MAG: bifunctional precorrin-2 dehydrogenase/sirohydrochlorin ferrochelatase [Euryarchaeota archaeon]|nr:bifunctional precorrin-2 dehydrogenase/sirohydrochlorin ferrochelatase [Euryarchaeota archaeon]